MDPHGRRESWYVYRYFEGVYERDLARFPTWRQIAADLHYSLSADPEVSPVLAVGGHDPTVADGEARAVGAWLSHGVVLQTSRAMAR